MATGKLGSSLSTLGNIVLGSLEDEDTSITYRGYGQAQASIIKTFNAYGQAQAKMDAFGVNAFGQAQAQILGAFTIRYGHGQAQAEIGGIRVSQVTLDVVETGNPSARVSQLTLDVVETGNPFGRVSQVTLDVVIKINSSFMFAQAQAFIKPRVGHGQAQASILQVYQVYGQAQADILQIYNAYAQAEAFIRKSAGYANAQADILQVYQAYGQAQAHIIIPALFASAQAQARMLAFKTKSFGQARAYVFSFPFAHAQAQAFIRKSAGYGQAQARIFSANTFRFAQAQAFIYKGVGFGQAQAQIISYPIKVAQAQAFIRKSMGLGQARARIASATKVYAQARASIKTIGGTQHAQAQAYIIYRWAFGQAQAYIGHFQTGQAQAYIVAFDRVKVGQAQAFISGKYLVRFNGYDLPGYAQTEDYESPMTINRYGAAYHDMPSDSYLGLTNKPIIVQMSLFEDTYYQAKENLQKAATMVRSTKDFAKLYIQRADRYYLALTRRIAAEKAVKSSSRILGYEVEFEAKPWQYSNQIYSISGTTFITATRTFDDGGWTPTIVYLSGSNITVSGYTQNEPFTGFISVSGSVTNLIVDSEAYTATVNGINQNALMNNDYRLNVGPETTYFVVAGATSCVITYQNRYYL